MTRRLRGSQDGTSCRVDLLGGFRVSGPSGDIDLPADGRRLVAFLGLQGRKLGRSRTAGTLWPDGSQKRAFGNLRSALWRVRAHTEFLIDADSRAVGLLPRVTVDVDVANETAAKLFAGEMSASEDCDLALFINELLPGWDDDFVLVEREGIRQQSLHALEAIAEQQRMAGHFGAALRAAMAAIKIDPLRESAHRCAIRVHFAECNPSEARRHYRVYSRILSRELGLRPSARLTRLVGAVVHSPALSLRDRPPIRA